MQGRVHDIDTHDERAAGPGADIPMPLEEAFYGERRYEANDPKANAHFREPFTDVRAEVGDTADSTD
jgi:hypothetical protein